MKPFKAPYVKLMQAEVTRLVDEFVVPVDVKDFSELHDYIDVNELGGFCDESSSAPLIEMYGDEAFSDFVTECQSEVDAWIRAGGCGKDSYFDGYLSDFAKLIRSEKKWQHLRPSCSLTCGTTSVT